MPRRELGFHIVDVFAESKYAGNQLAVVKNADGLISLGMQRIAREFNFSETTFITSKGSQGFGVRIFTPKNELPFAGHPTLGTAWVIQQHLIRKKVAEVSLNLKVGEIPVTFQYRDGKPDVLWMKQKQPKFGTKQFERALVSKVLRIGGDEIDSRLPVQEVSTGIPFLIVPLKKLKSLKRCTIDREAYFSLIKKTRTKSILAFCSEAYNKSSDLAVRVFTEYYGVPEDPATGSGNGCLAAYLSIHKYFGKSEICVNVDQGYEIGRPSKLYLKTECDKRKIGVSVGGKVIPVAEGKLVA